MNGATSIPASFNALRKSARDIDCAGRVAVNADGVGAHLDDLAGHRDHRAVLHHPHHARGDLVGIVQHRAGLAARHQRAVVLIGAVGEDFMHHRQVGGLSSLHQA